MSINHTKALVTESNFPWSHAAQQLVYGVAGILNDPEVAQACCGKGEAEIRDVLMARAGPLFAKFKRENNL